ncbi:hypothetical protein ACOI22_15580 [Glaciecola sp. 2405UD65-10]|uniref:hypothetical protein n=1 Tax=Glaciecola sp. 2405UD65-10 TaxID=3397244 RepID=UPI003B5A8A16
MSQIHSILLILHIVVGSLAIILFWVPMLTQKGRLNHIKFGKYYTFAMYTVAASGALMAILVIAAPLLVKHEYANHEHGEQIAFNLRVFWTFLLYLALLTYTNTKQGVVMLRVKENRHLLRTFGHVAPLVALVLGGVALVGLGVAFNKPLHIVFGILGFVIAVGSLRYIFAAKVGAKHYIKQHIGHMLGSGIGAYTAFVTFGGRQLLELPGGFQFALWLAPGLIGGIASYVLTKKYSKVFNIA